MLRNIFQRSLTRPIVAKSVIKTTLPASTRFFSVNAKQQQEAETLKPTSGKNSYKLICPFKISKKMFVLDSLGFESKPVSGYDRPIYLDMQATSPTDPRVLDAMIPYMTELYGNPHSRTHKYGWETEDAVEKAREVKIKIIVLII